MKSVNYLLSKLNVDQMRTLLSKSLFFILLGTTSATMGTGRIDIPHRKRCLAQTVPHDSPSYSKAPYPPKKKRRLEQPVSRIGQPLPPEVVNSIYSFLEKSEHKNMRYLDRGCNRMWQQTANHFIFTSSGIFLRWALAVLAPPELYLKNASERVPLARHKIWNRALTYIKEYQQTDDLLPDQLSIIPSSWGKSIHLLSKGEDTDQNYNAFFLKKIQWTTNKFILRKLIKFTGKTPHSIDEDQASKVFEVLDELKTTFASCDKLYGYTNQIKQFFSDCTQGQLDSVDTLKVFTDALDKNKKVLFRGQKFMDTDLDVITSLAHAHLQTSEGIDSFLGSMEKLNKKGKGVFSKSKKIPSNTLSRFALGHIRTTEEANDFVSAVRDNQNKLFETNGLPFHEIMTRPAKKDLMIGLAEAGLCSTEQLEAISKLYSTDSNYSTKLTIVKGLRIGNLKTADQINNFADAVNENKERLFDKKTSQISRMNIIFNLAAAGFHSGDQVKAVADIFSLNKLCSSSQHNIIFELRKKALITADKIHSFTVALKDNGKSLLRGLSANGRGIVIGDLLKYGIVSAEQIKAVSNLITTDINHYDRCRILYECGRRLWSTDKIQSFADAVNENHEHLFGEHPGHRGDIILILLKTNILSGEMMKKVQNCSSEARSIISIGKFIIAHSKGKIQRLDKQEA